MRMHKKKKTKKRLRETTREKEKISNVETQSRKNCSPRMYVSPKKVIQHKETHNKEKYMSFGVLFIPFELSVTNLITV